jgi:methionyl aminopeptidase
MISIKSEREIECMRRAGKIVGEAICEAEKVIEPGITTGQIDSVIRKYIISQGAMPSFLGYRGFPANSCISVNEEVIHGIPGKRKLLEGDIVSLDVGAAIDGFHGDSAATFPVGRISGEALKLIEVTKQCFYQALPAIRAGGYVSMISEAISQYAAGHGYGVVQKYTGHGVGRDMHESPEIPNFVTGKRGARLVRGMTFAVEPMILMGGGYEVEVLRDGWTVVSSDGSLAAHYEHTVLVTGNEPELLTARNGDCILSAVLG